MNRRVGKGSFEPLLRALYYMYAVLTKTEQKRSCVETPHPFGGSNLKKPRATRNSLGEGGGKELSRKTVPCFSEPSRRCHSISLPV